MNVVWSNLGRENAGSFQREQDLYEFGPQLNDLPESADVTSISGTRKGSQRAKGLARLID